MMMVVADGVGDGIRVAAVVNWQCCCCRYDDDDDDGGMGWW